MTNKTLENEFLNGRPCYFCFRDADETSIYWMIPISSNIEKYEQSHASKIKKYRKCLTLHFGKINHSERVFLIQNMFPVTAKYIQRKYTDSSSHVICIERVLAAQIYKKAIEVLKLHRNGTNIIFPNVLEIERKLIEELQSDEFETLS